MAQSRLTVIPCELKEANAFVTYYHRHHEKVQGHKFSFAVVDDEGVVRGVGIVGRPRARLLDDGWTLEVLRIATDGCENACSALYGAAKRVAFALGYRKVITYILKIEPGTSLKAVQWTCIGEAGGGTWNRKDRPRWDKHPIDPKVRYEMTNHSAFTGTVTTMAQECEYAQMDLEV